MRVRYSSKLWYGLVAYLASVGGTVLLASELDRPWAVLLLISAAVLAVIVWGRQEWIPAFPRYPVTRVTFFKHSSFIHWFVLLVRSWSRWQATFVTSPFRRKLLG